MAKESTTTTHIGGEMNVEKKQDSPSTFLGNMITDGNTMSTSATRHLKETGGTSHDQGSDGPVSLEDYRPFDPSPSSKASVRPGPIQHGTPLLPYIPNPKPSPPSHSDHDGSPSHSNDDGSPPPTP